MNFNFQEASHSRSAGTTGTVPREFPLPEALAPSREQVEVFTQTPPGMADTVSNKFHAGNLSNYQSEWAKIINNPQILDYVNGVKNNSDSRTSSTKNTLPISVYTI